MPSPCVPGSGWRTIRASSRLPARSWNGSGRTVAGTATRARQDDARHSTSHSRPPGGYTSTRWQRAPVGQAFAAARAAELFLEHRLFRSLQSGEVIDDAWLVPHYPPYWHYDVPQALLVLARMGKAQRSPCTGRARAADRPAARGRALDSRRLLVAPSRPQRQQCRGRRLGQARAQRADHAQRAPGVAGCGRACAYQVRHVCRDRNNPWPWWFEQLTPVTSERQSNILCVQSFPYGNVT